MKLHASGEDYLEAILVLHKRIDMVLIAAGVDPKIAEADACRLEHVISSESFERLKETADQ